VPDPHCDLESIVVQITVKLFATFRVGRFIEEKREYPQGTRIADVITELKVPEAEIGMIMLNNKSAEPDHQLQEGERLAIFPVVGGG
jgi:molybdopterin synthase sulfur carrier subunit